MKLELKHLAPYLPYELKVFTHGIKTTIFSFNPDYGTVKFIDRGGDPYNTSIESIKPILRPLSDLSKEVQIAEYYMTFREHLNRLFPAETTGINLATWSQRSFEWLLKHHFDVFGLINKGLAIDINTLES